MPEQPFISEQELYLWNNGRLEAPWKKLGAHPGSVVGRQGAHFAVWAPRARAVAVVGDHFGWGAGAVLERLGASGVWYGFFAGVGEGARYKYRITAADGRETLKSDPFAFFAERRPATASVVRSLGGYRWRDEAWMRERRIPEGRPFSVYELHAGSWRHNADGTPYTYWQLARELPPYLLELGYTHLELLPLMEHPFDGSWGYQLTGYFAATSRYGTPEELMALIDACHLAGIGVLLDWVPGHFCKDEHGLARFDGGWLFEQAEHAEWGTLKFDFARAEVAGFLKASACFWLECYHADGLRVDGVTSMLYLDFGIPEAQRRSAGEGEIDPAAVAFLRELGEEVGRRYPGTVLIAEESTAFPLVTYPPSAGGLGFHYKWNMGWMNDTLRYFQTDCSYRSGCHELLSFSMSYAFSENYILPLSHDEVVHGKRSLIGRMPGDYWRQFAGLRLLGLYQMTHPGGKLDFMGEELAQFIEWDEKRPIDWLLLDYEPHRRHKAYRSALNHFYRNTPALWELDRGWEGFEWIDADNAGQSVLCFLRRGKRQQALVVLNFTPATYEGYRVGVPQAGRWREAFSSDALAFGGSGKQNPAPLSSEPMPAHGKAHSLALTLPPLGGAVFIPESL